jgi:hypothetical protein
MVECSAKFRESLSESTLGHCDFELGQNALLETSSANHSEHYGRQDRIVRHGAGGASGMDTAEFFYFRSRNQHVGGAGFDAFGGIGDPFPIGITCIADTMEIDARACGSIASEQRKGVSPGNFNKT